MSMSDSPPPPRSGLDLTYLRGLSRPRHDTTDLSAQIRSHLDDADGYVAFSGGKDSLVVLDLARSVDPNVPVVFFDSGAEYPETYDYLARIADHWRLRFEVVAAEPPLLTALAVTGMWDHDAQTTRPVAALHDILITEPSRQAHAAHGPGELWGVRADESAKGTGRWALYHRALADEVARACHGCCNTRSQQRRRHGGLITRADGTRVFGPVWNWSSTDVWAHIARRGLPVNPVYAKLQALGVPERHQRVSHVVDGSFLERGRVTWLRRGWPDLFEQIATVLPRIREFV